MNRNQHLNTRMGRNMKKAVTGVMSAAMLLSAAGPMAVTALASDSSKDWGEYHITNDGYGYLTANFPAEYTDEFIIYENETSTAQQVEALMYILNEDEKESLLDADADYWKGVSRLGIPEIKAAESGFPAPGLYAAAASFSEDTAASYGTAAAEKIKSENENMLYVSADALKTEDGGSNDILLEGQIGAVAQAMTSDGIITGIETLGGEDVSSLSEDEIDAEVTDLLTQIGKGGYLGMVQKSRDGLAAEDTDAPDTIALALTGEDPSEALAQAARESAVLLKNDDVLPLAQADVSAVDGADQAAIETDDAVILYVTSAQENADFLDEQIAQAKEGSKKVILVLAGSEPENIDAWAADADAVLEVWGAVENESEVLGSLLTGETNPSGKLPVAWPSESDDTAWAFGYGLSYTDYSYEITSAEPAAGEDENYGYDVTVSVTNEGDVAGEAVVQLYLSGLADSDDAQENALASYAKTDVMEAGDSAEVTLHIGESSLGTENEDGEVQVTEGTRMLYVSSDSTDTENGQELEVKAAKAGASVEASVPETITAGEAFDVTVSTPSNVISLQMTDADGNPYQPLDVLKENLGDSITFTYTLQIDAAGQAQINIYTTTPDGPGTEPAATLDVEVN